MEANYWYIITGMATSFLLCTAILIFYLKYRKNIIQQQYQLKVSELEHQKELLYSIVNTQENERKRIAIALHDDIGNRLNILLLRFDDQKKNEQPPPNQVSNEILGIIDTARNISHSLYPVNLDNLGLALYIEELISALSNKIIVLFRTSGEYQNKNTFIEVQLYRIIQEFTTNVIKHSDAAEIDIWIRGNSRYIALILSDNGHGFNYSETTKGMGLKNIELRIRSLNAFYKWKNAIGKRSRLIIKIPQNNG